MFLPHDHEGYSRSVVDIYVLPYDHEGYSRSVADIYVFTSWSWRLF